MFYYLEGKVAHVEPYLAVIDCGGVGYACRTTNHTIRQLKKGEVKRLYTYLNVGDGIFELYGFATEQELNSFKLLIGVSGVGPKAALAILSVGTPEHLTMAVITGADRRARRRKKARPAHPSGIEGQDRQGNAGDRPAGLGRRCGARQREQGGGGRCGARGARLHAAGHFRGAQGRGRGDSAARGDRAPEPEKNGEVKKANAE